MNKIEFGKHLYKYFNVVGVMDLEFANREITRLELSPNILVDKYKENVSRDKVYRNIFIKELKRNGIPSFREENNFYMSNLKVIMNEDTRIIYREILEGIESILKNINSTIDNVTSSENAKVLERPILELQVKGTKIQIIYLAVGGYSGVIEQININKDKDISYFLILDSKNIKKYKAFSLELGIKYKYVINDAKTMIFRSWNEIDEWSK